MDIMQGLSEDPDTPLSAWRVDKENKVYAKSLRDVERFVTPLVADNGDLIDPPLQMEEIRELEKSGKNIWSDLDTDSRDETILSNQEIKEIKDNMTLNSDFLHTKRSTTRP